jgi:hypothetical protein
MATKEEARAAVETEIALNTARPMTSLKGANFARSLMSFELPIQPDQTREFRAWVKRRREMRTLISNAVSFARHSGSISY